MFFWPDEEVLPSIAHCGSVYELTHAQFMDGFRIKATYTRKDLINATR